MDDTDERLAVLEYFLGVMEVHTDDADSLAWAGAVGAYHSMIRSAANGIWEELHAQGHLEDSDMMRVNAQGVRLIHDGVIAERDWVQIAEELTSTTRRLPDGRTFGDVARNRGMAKMQRDAIKDGRHLRAIARAKGYRASVVEATAGVTRGSSGTRWFGMPQWPAIVDTFCAAVDDPEHPHWREGYPTDPRPSDIADTADLRRALLAGPDTLSAEAARWIIRRGVFQYVLPDRAVPDTTA